MVFYVRYSTDAEALNNDDLLAYKDKQAFVELGIEIMNKGAFIKEERWIYRDILGGSNVFDRVLSEDERLKKNLWLDRKDTAYRLHVEKIQ